MELVRRLYRSGESEYLIDGAQCRLRDMHELLMDTGLGAKAYAIIEQGKIGMILSSRPTDRRQLIEEAAGITKYKARRRSAELKLEAAQQNLTRIDDIVFEVDKQRGSLKRQAAKARRVTSVSATSCAAGRKCCLRAGSAICRRPSNRPGSDWPMRASASRWPRGVWPRSTPTSAGLRIELAEADSAATTARNRAHTHELDIQRTQQQVELNRQQVATLGGRVAELDAELAGLEARREPQQLQIADRRDAAARAEQDRQQAADRLADHNEQYQIALREIEGLEGDVETARSEVFAAINAATALRHSIDSASAARERMQEGISRLDIEETDLRVESERLAADRIAAEQDATGVQTALAATRSERAVLEAGLARRPRRTCDAGPGTAHPRTRPGRLGRAAALARGARSGSCGLHGRGARAAGRRPTGTWSSAARWPTISRSIAGTQRAVEALLGDLLQHVVVPTHEHAAAGMQLLREQQAGRCGFVVLARSPAAPVAHGARWRGRASPISCAWAAPMPTCCAPWSLAATSPSPGRRPCARARRQAWTWPRSTASWRAAGMSSSAVAGRTLAAFWPPRARSRKCARVWTRNARRWQT